ncbi:GNAT family N-acetyltransferase [Shewanella sp. D64]|uniref:GNAT family N-acetyltransferase n=1 Tax=unclassified Shewanella TaxID=196818 RepID=UPI0022BA6786|nr:MULTISPECIES: GNAT family protein [unclassified Shewanella]MEC4726005.1 GNAT family N-acetyltransferase [Shewanella sp. D64]MEC4737260.1 GNAT family N-acetyltransferase [Shewanella sp. E94]WBJ93637.1 GNAT family N-acetyltransferase [Shewanella sp. MTB7]
MLELYTQRLRLRTLKREDVQDFLRVHHDPIVNQFVRVPESEAVILEQFEHKLSPWAYESGDWLTLTIEEISSNRFIGFTGLYCSNLVLGHAEVGYMLAVEGQGKGYATESLKAVIDWACLSCNVHKFIGTCSTGNLASVRVLEKAGFKLEGVLRHNFKIDERWIDDNVYGLLSEERSR